MTLPTHASRSARTALLLALLAAPACSAGDDAAAGDTTAAAAAAAPSGGSQSADEMLGDVADYELTMEKIDRYMAVQRSLATKAAAMSPAEREAFKQRNDSGDSDEGGDIDAMTAKLEREPMMRDAIREAGLSPREFTMITLAMLQSAMAASVLQMRPNDDQDSLAREMKANPKNIKFMQEHQAEIQRKQQELAAEMKRLGLDDSDG